MPPIPRQQVINILHGDALCDIESKHRLRIGGHRIRHLGENEVRLRAAVHEDCGGDAVGWLAVEGDGGVWRWGEEVEAPVVCGDVLFGVGDGEDAGYGVGEDLGFMFGGDEVDWVECHLVCLSEQYIRVLNEN